MYRTVNILKHKSERKKLKIKKLYCVEAHLHNTEEKGEGILINIKVFIRTLKLCEENC